jgi:predicted transcriptional regulator
MADSFAVDRLRGDEIVQVCRDVEAGDYTIDGPVVLGPGPAPEDGSCGQFAVQFHVSTSTVARLKRIADARGMSVPELCRQVVGVFVAQQEGDLAALLAAEAEAADYRPSLGRHVGTD